MFLNKFQTEGEVVHTFIGKANEWKLKRMLKTHIPKCQKESKFLVMFGIHGSEEGLLLQTDENLRIAFNEAICSVKRTEKDILQEKAIRIEPLEIQTRKLESGKMELVDKFTVAERSRNCNQLVLCFCYTKVNESNSFFRSTGLYTELYMNQDISNLQGRLIKFDLDQKKFLERYTQERPQNVLVLGPFGCGKTVFVTQFMAIKISELETANILFIQSYHCC